MPKHFLIAMDSFKGCLSSRDAGEAAAQGVLQALPDAQIECCAIADGGEGTLDAFSEIPGARRMECVVEGPYRASVTAHYLILGDGTAVVETAQAAGITLSSRREPIYASTFGVGMVIRDAVKNGCRCILVGLGGSATNDGGAGMLQALGFDLLDGQGNPIARGAVGLQSLASVDDRNVLPGLRECRFCALCDVMSPMLGAHGCSTVFGPQKGANPRTVRDLEQWLTHFADIAKQSYPEADPMRDGTGAAGGLGFALKTFCHAALTPGLPYIAQALHLEDKIRRADIVITGEGCIDAQTSLGKAAAQIAELSQPHAKPVIALVGSADDSILDHGIPNIDAIFSILRKPCSLTEAMDPQYTRENIQFTAMQIARII